jgi:hypothetical protein
MSNSTFSSLDRHDGHQVENHLNSLSWTLRHETKKNKVVPRSTPSRTMSDLCSSQTLLSFLVILSLSTLPQLVGRLTIRWMPIPAMMQPCECQISDEDNNSDSRVQKISSGHMELCAAGSNVFQKPLGNGSWMCRTKLVTSV